MARVLVVGAGVAGLAMARALRERGVSFLLVDQFTGPATAGLGVNLPGNAVVALRALGVDLCGLGVPITRREYRSATGRLLFAVDEIGFWGRTRRRSASVAWNC